MVTEFCRIEDGEIRIGQTNSDQGLPRIAKADVAQGAPQNIGNTIQPVNFPVKKLIPIRVHFVFTQSVDIHY